MKNVRKANFLQVNNEIRRLLAEEGAIMLSSSQAYKKLKWTRDYFEQKPEEGYFIWVKKQISHPPNHLYSYFLTQNLSESKKSNSNRKGRKS